jgi:hypothetical protein
MQRRYIFVIDLAGFGRDLRLRHCIELVMNLVTAETKVIYLRSLPSVRDRCSKVFEVAKSGNLEFFDYHPEQEVIVAKFCAEIIQVRMSGFPTLHLALNILFSEILAAILPRSSAISVCKAATKAFEQIPPHGRWRHFNQDQDRIQPLMDKWKSSSSLLDESEISRRLIDLFVVSVLLDAGAGTAWKYIEPLSKKSYSRSEGLAICSLYMFQDGLFSSVSDCPEQVDGA